MSQATSLVSGLMLIVYLLPASIQAQIGQIIEGESAAVSMNFDGPAPNKDLLHVAWVDPDPSQWEGDAYMVNTDLLKARLMIISSYPLDKARFSILRNGAPLPEGQKMEIMDMFGKSLLASIPLEVGDNHLAVKVTFPTAMAMSDTITITYSPIKPRLFVFSVGPSPDLMFSQQDAMDFARLFSDRQDQLAPLFSEVHVSTMIGDTAESNRIMAGLEEYTLMHNYGNLGAQDLLLVFFSSHGVIHKNRFYLHGSKYESGRYRSTALEFEELREILDELPCKKLVFVDACYSGGAKAANPEEVNQQLRQLNLVQGMSMLVSSKANQFSYEDPQWENGAFTEGIVSGLGQGEADLNDDQMITIYELATYLGEKVPALVKETKGPHMIQHPELLDDQLGDVVIYVLED